MKQIKNILSIAALVLAGTLATGCVDQLNDPKQSQDGDKTVTLTTTIGLDASTKALTAAGVKTFAVDDQIAVVYKNTLDETAVAISAALVAEDIHNEGKSAEITVSLTNPAANGALRLIYPAAMAQATIAPDATIDDAGTIDFTKLDAQDGTLASLASALDLAVFDGALTSESALPAFATLTNRLAIGEFTIKNADGSLNITNTISSLTVSDGVNSYTVSPAAPATNFGNGPIYVAMRPVADDKTLTFTTAVGSKNNTKTVTGQALEAGNMYPVGLKFGGFITAYSGYEAQNGDIITGSHTAHYITVADGATITLRDLSIQSQAGSYTNPYDGHYAAVHLLGSATIYLNGTNTLRMIDACVWPALYVPQGSTLTVKGDGDLFAYGGEMHVGFEGSAAIGGGKSYNGRMINCGNIVIDGGTIEARGGYGGAGIGCGGGEGSSCGSITINGGTVGAYGSKDAAGIGSVNWEGSSCGAITINGGIIHAYGGDRAAGIGSGNYYGSCGTISINIHSSNSNVSAQRGAEAQCHVGYPRSSFQISIASGVTTNYPAYSSTDCFFFCF